MQRRTFLKAAAVGGGVALGFDLKEARAEMRALKISRTTETRSTCPYCAVSCGVIIHTTGDRARNVKATVVPPFVTLPPFGPVRFQVLSSVSGRRARCGART